LAYGYFRGGERLQRQIEEGNIEWTLRRMKAPEPSHGGAQELSEAEWKVIGDLELAQKYLLRLQYKLSGDDLNSKAFHAQASLLAEGLLGMLDGVTAQLKKL
jgi:hypothetical protein